MEFLKALCLRATKEASVCASRMISLRHLAREWTILYVEHGNNLEIVSNSLKNQLLIKKSIVKRIER
jgi:hypothetical protein